MSDPDLVKLRLTFWNGDKKPGDVIEVRREDVASWKGYAVPVDDTAAKSAEKAPVKQVTTEPSKAPAK
ncbi:hypothetical protein [Streptomyces sp. 4R-3d]|uniref:hypothetical protein n=1 Tax=Streptomyces sp. 4R-3d TaxID=2559605 RepID=UPI001072D6AE|nr:hypothetical protein [Streptomyces sp. 4R-3d]TFI30164.1 hypothetical protein E4P36_05290 [Streptomyces sp. 4R-3d]